MSQSVYLTGGLVEAPPNYKILLKSVIIALTAKRLTRLSFSFQALIGKVVTGENLYSSDREQLLASGAMIAFCDYQSTPMGMEVAMAHEYNKKVILLYDCTKHPSQYVLDFAEFYGYPALSYVSSGPATDIIGKVLAKLNS
jgi:hypothetical protein